MQFQPIFVAYSAGAVAGAIHFIKTKVSQARLKNQVNQSLVYIHLASETAIQAVTGQSEADQNEALQQAKAYLDRAQDLTGAISDRAPVVEKELTRLNVRVSSGLDLLRQAGVAHHKTVRSGLTAHALTAISAGKSAPVWSFSARSSSAGRKALLTAGLVALGVLTTLLLGNPPQEG
jgi:hypothetical protein